jgi:carbonic anhydrase
MLPPTLMLSEHSLAENNRRFSAAFTGAQLSHTPARKLLVLTCMDTRIDPLPALGLAVGDAHVLRNAGGRVSDDAIRSIVVSQQLLGTRQVLVIHHTRCGLLDVTNEQLREKLSSLGEGVNQIDFLPLGSDVTASVRGDVNRLRQHPLLAPDSVVQGYIFDVATGELKPVT